MNVLIKRETHPILFTFCSHIFRLFESAGNLYILYPFSALLLHPKAQQPVILTDKVSLNLRLSLSGEDPDSMCETKWRQVSKFWSPYVATLYI